MIQFYEFISSNWFASVTGGLVGGTLTLQGVRASIRAENQKTVLVADAEIRAFCESVLTELESLLGRYNDSIGNQIAEHDETQPFLKNHPAEQDYFTVFNSNASMLGKISDRGTRSKIIEAYIYAKAALDSLRYNNRSIEKFERLTLAARNGAFSSDLDHLKGEMAQYSKRLKSLNLVVRAKIGDAVEDLRSRK